MSSSAASTTSSPHPSEVLVQQARAESKRRLARIRKTLEQSTLHPQPLRP